MWKYTCAITYCHGCDFLCVLLKNYQWVFEWQFYTHSRSCNKMKCQFNSIKILVNTLFMLSTFQIWSSHLCLAGWVRGGRCDPQEKSQRNSRFSALSENRGTRAPPPRACHFCTWSLYMTVLQKVHEHRECLSMRLAKLGGSFLTGNVLKDKRA